MASKPSTQKETLDALWYAVIGTNGSGLVGKTNKLEEELDGLKEACLLGRNGKKPKRIEILTGLMFLALGLQTLGVPKLIGDMFRNWVAGG